MNRTFTLKQILTFLTILLIVGISVASIITGLAKVKRQETTSHNSNNLNQGSKELDSISIRRELKDKQDIEGIVQKKINEQRQLDAENAIYQRKMYIRNNWKEFFKVSGDYDWSDLGGIYNHVVSFENKSEYPIDYAVITIYYVKRNGSVWKTEKVAFLNVPALQKSSIKAPESNRGTSCEYKVSRIQANYVNLSYNSEHDFSR